MKTLFILCGAVILSGLSSLYYRHTNQPDAASSKSTPVVPVMPISAWPKYINSYYGYSLRIPSGWKAGVEFEEDRTPAEQSTDVAIFGSGLSQPGVVTISARSHNELPKSEIDLEVFADTQRGKDIQNDNPNYPSKTFSSLQKTMFAGRPAYTYSFYEGSYDMGGSRSGRYVFVDATSTRFIIYYSLGLEFPQQIANTFAFVATPSATSSSILNGQVVK